MRLRICPRCRTRGYEVLKTHAYCLDCNYSPTFERDLKHELTVKTFSRALKDVQGFQTESTFPSKSGPEEGAALFPELEPTQISEEKTEAA